MAWPTNPNKAQTEEKKVQLKKKSCHDFCVVILKLSLHILFYKLMFDNRRIFIIRRTFHFFIDDADYFFFFVYTVHGLCFHLGELDALWCNFFINLVRLETTFYFCHIKMDQVLLFYRCVHYICLLDSWKNETSSFQFDRNRISKLVLPSFISY